MEAVASRQQEKKIRQKHQEAVTKAGVATPKTEKKQIHKIIRKEVTSSTRPIMNYQEGYNISAEEHKINSLEKTENLIMIYNETTTDVYIDKEERIRPENPNNHNTDRPDICLDKPKQEVKRGD